MENHLRLIVQSAELSKHLRAFKSWTTREIIDRLNQNSHRLLLSKLRKVKISAHVDSNHQVWQEGFYPKQVVGDAMMSQKVDYIHKNPVKRGFVGYPEHWRYSSARKYLEMEVLIPVTLFGSE